MKIRKINLLLAVSFGVVIALAGCSKDDGAIRKRITIDDVPAITTTIDASGSQFIPVGNQASFAGKVKADLYFPGATPPAKIDIVVRKNGSVSNVKLFKADVMSLPAVLTVTSAEIATLFGAPLVLNDTYDFAPDIYVGAKKFEAFPAVGTGTGAGVRAMPLFSEFARFTVR